MSKLFKKQIKRSFPIFLIFSLIVNFTLYGLIFNLNFDQVSSAKLSLGKVAQASTTAQTSVTVRNAPPEFPGDAQEAVTSASTSPVNVGGAITFNLPTNASRDPENNNIKLLICKAGMTATTSGGVRCLEAGATLCTSNWASTTQSTSASTSCTYNPVQDPGAESQAWQAWVCDDHPNQPACYNGVAKNGSAYGEAGSPFYINHAPTVDFATTSVNFVNPGQAFTVTATTSDTDTQGGADQMAITVCSTNSYSTTTNTCGAVTICTSTLASGVTHSCVSTTTVPLMHGNYGYFVFVKDQHSFSTSSSKAGSYDINDVAPTVGAITFNNGSDIGLGMKGFPDRVVWATSSSLVDNNGCSDIAGQTATSTFYQTTLGYNCSANDNNCYKIATSSCFITGCAGNNATVACTASLKYFAVPTVASGTNPRASDSWTASIKVFDHALSSTIATSTSVDVQATLALDVSEPTIPYGVMQGGQNSGTVDATTTVVNLGNVPMNTNLSGTDMVRAGGGTIAFSQQKFSTSTAVTYTSKPYTLGSTTVPTFLDLSISRPTGLDESKQVYWGISIPGGLLSGDYNGTNLFEAILDSTSAGW